MAPNCPTLYHGGVVVINFLGQFKVIFKFDHTIFFVKIVNPELVSAVNRSTWIRNIIYLGKEAGCQTNVFKNIL